MEPADASLAPTEPTPAATSRETQQIALHGVLAGLCPLIPIPFLDDAVLQRVRTSLGRELLADHALSPEAVRTLAGADSKPVGCGTVLLLPLRLAFKLFLKLFRRLTIVLAVKEALDTASHVLHEGWLLAAAKRRADLHHHDPDAVRRAIEVACSQVDPRPVEQVLKRSFRGSRAVLHRAARTLARSPVDAVPLTSESPGLASLVDRFSTTLQQQQGYFAELEHHYVLALTGGPAEERDSEEGTGAR
jgi:hypothetical protein